MHTPTIPRILLLDGGIITPHALRTLLRRAGLASNLRCAATRADLIARIGDPSTAQSIDLALVPAAGLPALSAREALRLLSEREPAIPAVLMARNREELDSLRTPGQYVPVCLMPAQQDHLPLVVDRALRDNRASSAQALANFTMDKAASMLRENQKLITIGRMAASIAHEINNPLESITNLLYLLGQESALPDRSKEYLSLVEREMERVVQISKQTLNFSRESSTPVRVQVTDLLEEVLVLYSRKLAEKRLQVVRQYESGDPVVVYPGEMRQVLSNLVANAIEASSPGGRLFLRTRATRKWSDSGVRGLRISIGDNGSGIDPRVRQRLGQPFFTTKGQRGTGLGLWVTHSIITRYGGDLQLHSSVNAHRHGTVFSIFLPTNMHPQAVTHEVRGGGGRGGANVGTGRAAPVTGPFARTQEKRHSVNGG